MSVYTYPITITFEHQLRFTRGAFDSDNLVLSRLLTQEKGGSRVIVFLEQGVHDSRPGMEELIKTYFAEHCPHLEWKGLYVSPGGEEVKNDPELWEKTLDILRESGLDRHSYVIVIGGGAFLDMIGFAAAVTHRGLRLVRFPTTTLSQDDSGVGVKNGINAYGMKNFLGSFSVPFAVVNDFDFLETLPENNKLLGLIEAVKVALVKDAAFFSWLESHAEALKNWEKEAVHYAVERSAVLHAEHIALSGDPFEQGSSRPLDFGHWAAHKLEQMSRFELTHAEAVSIGIALDVLYSALSGLMEAEEAMRILALLEDLKMPLWSPLLEETDGSGKRILLNGLDEFREHLGGELTVLMIQEPGISLDVHEIKADIVEEAVSFLKTRAEESSIVS